MFLLVGAVHGAAAERAPSARALARVDGAQIVFTWPRAVRYSAAVAGNRMVVTFARPFTGNIGRLVLALPKVVAQAQISGDRRVVTLILTRPYILESRASGRSIVLSLTDASARRLVARAAPSAPRPRIKPVLTPPTPGSPVRVGARAGRHGTFDRLVFSWPGTIRYRVVQAGTSATLWFNRQGRVDLQGLRARLRGTGIGVERGTDAKRLVLLLRLPPDRHVVHFRQGGKVVLDVRRGAAPVGTQRRAAKPGKTATPPKRTAKTAKARESVVRGESAKPKALVPKVAKKLVKKPTDKPARPSPAAKPRVAAQVGGTRISLTKSGVAVTLRLDWPKRVAAAAFRRGRYAWLVFSEPVRLDLGPIRAGIAEPVLAIEQLGASGATALRLLTTQGAGMEMSREENSWLVRITPNSRRPKTIIAVKPDRYGARGARVVLSAVGPSPVLRIKDPDAGDDVLVVPVAAPGFGVDPAQLFIEFRLLSTAQGIVVEPLADGVKVTTGEAGVTITRGKGLRLSPRADAAPGKGSHRRPRGARLFDFAGWSGAPAGDFPGAYTRVKQELQRGIAVASDAERESRRLALARFHFAHGFAADALGVLTLIARDKPSMASDPGFSALRGAARLLNHDYDGAGDDLYHKSLDDVPEIALWRGALAAANGDWHGATNGFDRAGGLLRYYPKRLKSWFGLLAAEAALKDGNQQQARRYLTMLADGRPPRAARYRIDHLRGWVLAKSGEHKAAEAQWDRVASAAQDPVRLRAVVARMNSLLMRGRLKPKPAIAELDRQRFAWRGDDLEFSVLYLLGRLYLKTGDYANGLATLRRARKLYPALATKVGLQKRMRKAFAEMFIGGGADKLSPIKALALFDEHRQLLPSGPEREQIIENIVDRLVAVDLLNRAGTLLSEQLERLVGIRKIRVGARLAVIRLLERKPELALSALLASAYKNMPKALREQRRRLKARAHAALGRNRVALGLLDGDTHRDAELLRADIYWRTQNWKKAAVTFARLAGAIKAPKGGKSLGEADSRIILRWAVAAALAGDKAAMAEVRARYAAAMSGGPYADAFRVIANEIDRGGIDYASIVEKIAEVDQYQAFMSNYRARLQGAGLSAIN